MKSSISFSISTTGSSSGNVQVQMAYSPNEHTRIQMETVVHRLAGDKTLDQVQADLYRDMISHLTKFAAQLAPESTSGALPGQD